MIEESRDAIDGGLAGPWWRVLAMPAPGGATSAQGDFIAMRPAALAASAAGRPIAIGWFSRGGGAPLELITTTGPEGHSRAAGGQPADRGESPAHSAGDSPRFREAGPAQAGHGPAGLAASRGAPVPEGPVPEGAVPEPLLFPAGGLGVSAGNDLVAGLSRLTWVPCPGYRIPPPARRPDPAAGNGQGPGHAGPGLREPGHAGPGHVGPPLGHQEASLFESALVALMRRSFGWLVIAEPTDLLAAETAELQTELDILRRHQDQPAVAAIERAEHRLAELNAYGDAGLWSVRVLAGASSPDELEVLAPLLAGSVDLTGCPCRLRPGPGPMSLAEALAARTHDAVDGAQSPFFVTAGTLAALAGLPRAGVPGVTVSGAAGSTAERTGPGFGVPAPAGPSPVDLGPSDLGPGDLAPGDLGSSDPAPAGRSPVDLGPSDLGPSDLGPSDLGPGDLAPAGLGPSDPAPAGRSPVDLGPSDLGPGDLAPAGLGPSDPAPAGPSPVDLAPDDLAPDDLAPGGLGPAEPSRTGAPARARAGSIDLGSLLDRATPESEAGPGEIFRIPLISLCGGVLVAGGAGTGKSRTVRNILAQLTGLGLPWLAVGPAGLAGPAGSRAGVAATGTAAGPVTVIDPGDPDDAPLTVSPFAPEPGFPLPAHLALVHGLFDLALAADEPLSLITSQALRRVYEAAGWDLATGRGVPGAPAAPEIPGPGQLHAAMIDAIGRAGFDRPTRARLRGLAEARFGTWLSGPVGRFLHGGHPADLGELLRRDVVLAVPDLGTEQDRALVTGALVIRLAEHLRLHAPAGPGPVRGPEPEPGPRHVLVIEDARGLLRDHGEGRPASRAAERFAALLAEVGAHGEGVVLTERSPALLVPDAVRNPAVRIVHRLAARADQVAAAGSAPPRAGQGRRGRRTRRAGAGGGEVPALFEPGVALVLAGGTGGPRLVRMPAGDAGPSGAGAGAEAADAARAGRSIPVRGRRSATCGRQCREVRPCRLAELRDAELLARSDEDAWLRVWTETFLLGFLTDRPLPAAPAPVRRRWRGLSARPRECLLAQVVDHAVGVRAAALRLSYDPGRLAGTVAASAAAALGQATADGPDDGPDDGPGDDPDDEPGGVSPAARPGPAWVIPALRWLHEMERLCPLDGTGPAPGDHAPPLDFDLAGLADWPGIRAGQRVRALRRHPLSMERAGNRWAAWVALLGADGPAAFAADLGLAVPRADDDRRLSHAARLMEVGGTGSGPGWLEVALSWPRRFITSAGPGVMPGDAADCPSAGR